MKIILPLTALGLLSTLFLISQSVDPTKSIPIVEIDLAQRAQDEGATNAAFAGMTRGGDEVMLQAISAQPSQDDGEIILASDVSAQLRLSAGTSIDIKSMTARMNQKENSASLAGEVNFKTTTGYDIQSDLLKANFNDLRVESPGPVSGKGPPGTIFANQMVLSRNDQTNTSHLLFTGGVKLIYTGHIAEE